MLIAGLTTVFVLAGGSQSAHTASASFPSTSPSPSGKKGFPTASAPTATATHTAAPTATATPTPGPTPTPSLTPTSVPTAIAGPGAWGPPPATGTPTPTPPPAASGFVTTCGTGLCLNGAPYSIKGATAYGQYTNPSTEVSTAQAAGLNTLELVEFDSLYHELSDTESSTTWGRADRFIAAASAAHMHVILHVAEFGQSLQAAGYTMSSPTWQTQWNQYLGFIANRVNTVTGVPYRSDPTIAMVELWGEIPAPNYARPVGTTAQLQAWFANTMAYWRTLAPHTLVSSGGLSYVNDSHSGIPWQAIMSDPNNAVCGVEVNSSDDRNLAVPLVTGYCSSIGKPWFLAAWSSCQGALQGSWDINNYSSDSARAGHAQDMYQVARGAAPARYPSVGSDFWNLGPQPGNTCDIGPQAPLTWSAVRSA
jgi:hypothetical protein